jgi:hypothetical protein
VQCCAVLCSAALQYAEFVNDDVTPEGINLMGLASILC